MFWILGKIHILFYWKDTGLHTQMGIGIASMEGLFGNPSGIEGASYLKPNQIVSLNLALRQEPSNL